MTTIVTRPESKAYAIYSDNRKVVECYTPETTYNELVKNLGVDTTNVQVIELEYFPDVLGVVTYNRPQPEIAAQPETDIDAVIAKVNDAMNAPNRGSDATVSRDPQGITQDNVINEPVGNTDKPKLGDLVYVAGIDGILRKITGGVGTVHMVYNSDECVEANIGDVENDDIVLGDEDVVVNNVLIELEEIPGVYFSWNELKNSQTELKAKYGYKPACVIR